MLIHVCSYWRRTRRKFCYHVDDGIVAATDEAELLELTDKLKCEFKIVTKPATYFLGVEIDQRSDGSIKISQAAVIVGLEGIPEIQVDNEAAIRLVQNPEYHRRTKHILTRHFFVREKVTEGEIGVQKITTELQVADALTKPLHGPRMKQLMDKMGLE